jgi:MSHA biogenesis protein MshJ
MKERLLQVEARIDALSLRERGLLLLVAAAVLSALWWDLVLNPQLKAQSAVVGKMNQVQSEVQALDVKAQAILARRKQDPNTGTRRRIEALQAAVKDLDGEIGQRIGGMVSAKEMPRLLEEVLTRETDLRLVSIKSLPPQPLVPAQKPTQKSGAKTQRTAVRNIYRHGLEMVFEGTFSGTKGYLRALQALPRDLGWDTLELKTMEYPRIRVRIRVYTLSLQEGWIGV